MTYSLEKSITKAVKYPIFTVLAGFILKMLEMSVLGLNIQFPQGVDALTKPTTAIAVGVVILVYDILKHKLEINLP